MSTSAAVTADLVADSREVLAKHARSFQWASVFLPSRSRDSAAVVYAFCRLVDDLADEAPSPVVAERSLNAVRGELSGAAPARPLVAAVLALFGQQGTSPEVAFSLMDGVQSDLGRVRLQSDADLHRYCYQVAGTVGLMMCGVLGVASPAAAAHALDLGIAMQLTNICRDVREDAERGRVYLPEARLLAAGTSPDALLAGKPDEAALAVVTRDLLHMADVYYASGRDGLRFIPWRARLAIVVASAVYRAIGTRLRSRGSNPWLGRTFVPSSAKLWVTLRALGTFLTPNVLGWSAARPHRADLHLHIRDLPGANRSTETP